MIEYKSAEKLLKEHKPDGAGRCRICRSIGCTLFAAAVEAKRYMTAKKLGGSNP